MGATDQRKTILVVDDNDDSRELVVKVLSRRGYRLVEAADGEEALARIAQAAPDLVLLDISLPKMDGYEVLRRLRATSTWAGLPVVALTAHAMKGDREKFLAAGCQGYIAKPIDVRNLAAQVAHYLGEEG